LDSSFDWAKYINLPDGGKHFNKTKNGFWVHRNDNSSSMGVYDKGKKIGNWVTWDNFGNLLSEGKYVDGIRDGIWIEKSYKMNLELNKYEYGEIIQETVPVELEIDSIPDVIIVELSDVMKSIYSNDIELLLQLISSGNSVEGKTAGGKTPLMISIILGNVDITKILIENGVKINEQDDEGWTAIMYSLTKGPKEVIKYLIDNGASLNILDNLNTSVLDIAFAYNREEWLYVDN